MRQGELRLPGSPQLFRFLVIPGRIVKISLESRITSKLVANLLVAAGVNRILTMDLHAQQIQGFFDIPVDHLYASPVFFDELQSQDVSNMTIFSLDVGGMKMANAYAELLGCPLGFVAKRRTGASTVEAMNLVERGRGKRNSPCR